MLRRRACHLRAQQVRAAVAALAAGSLRGSRLAARNASTPDAPWSAAKLTAARDDSANTMKLTAQVPALLLLLLQRCACWERRAPWFEVEPAARVAWDTARGVRLHCAARADPAPVLAWLDRAGAPLPPRPPYRRVYDNGTLELSGRDAGGALTVRCRASNAHGVLVSRDVVLEARAPAELRAPPAAASGVAALACLVAGSPLDRVLWFRDDIPLPLPRPHQDSRRVEAGSLLLIRDVSVADAGQYTCAPLPPVGAAPARSPPATLLVRESGASAPPRLVEAGGARTVSAGAHFCLTCAAADHPLPHYTWYREREGRLQPVEGDVEEAWLWAGGAALCVHEAAPLHSGVWLCKAYNVFGDATARYRLDVRVELTVTVQPRLVRAAAGSTVRLTCVASDARSQLTWLHDGAPAGTGAELTVHGTARQHRGVYQCFARRDADSAQDSAELQLGESAPELVYSFIEQALRAGGSVSLRCAAAGAPPPRVSWLLDGTPLERYRAPHRFSMLEESVPGGDVVSALNITALTVADGGRYTCRANNALGSTEHSARLNVYGPPSIRALGVMRLVAGDNATVYCPYAGYPISTVSWRRRGAGAALGGTGRVSVRGAELRLAPVLAGDAGHYACSVAAPDGTAASQDVELQVRNPPKISPFLFSSELTEGSAAQVLCGVSSGDKPLYFSWLKDGAPLPPHLQVEEKSLNEFSLLMFTELSAAHSGAYTCRVANHAAAANYTARLTVHVPPAWRVEPLDAAVVLGAPLRLDCAALGDPAPTTAWHRDRGGGDSEQWEAVEGVELRGAGGALYAAAAARTHAGRYRCTADNGVGPPLVKLVNITVNEPARFEASGGNVSSVLGQSAVLWCAVAGDAPLRVQWTRAGRRLEPAARLQLVETRGPAGLRSTLTVHAVTSADAGEYRCVAHNAYGAADLPLLLRVEDVPEPPPTPRLAGLASRWARVAWRAPHAILRYRALCAPPHAPHAAVNITLEPEPYDGAPATERWLRARMPGLRPATTYALRLYATNDVGNSPLSDQLTFTTLEEAPAAAPRDVRVDPGGSGELHVSWSIPGEESWNGELLGYAVWWRSAEGAGGSEGRSVVAGARSSRLVLRGLRAGTRHAVAVRAYNRAGAGPASPPIYTATTPGVPDTPPSAVSCEAADARSLTVRWTAPAPPAPAFTGYDIQYAPLDFMLLWGMGREAAAARGGGGEATVRGLQPATNYSVWVRARSHAGPGPPAAPIYCTTLGDVPATVAVLRAQAAGADTVRVTWLAPAHARQLTHYTLYTRELGKSSGEWSQRVDATEGEQEVWREVRGLRPAAYDVWVRASARAGSGPPSRVVTAAPAHAVAARVSSFGRTVVAAVGASVRLPCAAVGTPPIRHRWSPLPPAHTITDSGDLVLHKVAARDSGNYTCSVRNAGGADVAVFVVAVVAPPAELRAPRVLRAEPHALHLAWDAPADGGAPLLGYTLAWRGAAGAGRARLPPDATYVLARLACGALYTVTLQAHNAAGDSPPSPPLSARTDGDKPIRAPAREFVWANESALRLNLLAWRTPCPVLAWSVAVRAAGGAWHALVADGVLATAPGLAPATWHDVRVLARSPAGDTTALYHAPTRSLAGEKIGEPVEVEMPTEDDDGAASATDGVQGLGVSSSWLGAACGGALLAVGAGAALAMRARRRRLPPPSADAVQQLYSTEPGHRSGKAPPSEPEISPYATFSAVECALHTFGHGEGRELAAPPPRPNLIAQAEYARRSSDSESSGSPCAACADTYAAPRAPRPRPRRPRPPPHTRYRCEPGEAPHEHCT